MLTNFLLAAIRLYQLTLSKVLLALFGPMCRFEPSCSRYAMACVAGQGPLRGSLLSLKRLCKCHPFHPGGYDPPPPPRPGRHPWVRTSDPGSVPFLKARGARTTPSDSGAPGSPSDATEPIFATSPEPHEPAAPSATTNAPDR